MFRSRAQRDRELAILPASVGDAAITCVAATPTHIISGAANEPTAPSTCCGFAGNPRVALTISLHKRYLRDSDL
jgi:hypothetical protein